MRVRYKDNSPEGYAYGVASEFNIHGIGEVIVGFDDEPDGTPNGADSMFIRDLEILINDTWQPMPQAFKNKDIVPNNYNTRFSPPIDQDAFERGYNW